MNENSKTLPNMSLTAFKALVGQQPVYVELVDTILAEIFF